MSRKAVIVGSEGQDGRLLTQHLAAEGYSTVPVTRKSHDIADPGAVGELISEAMPDEVYFLAAYHHSAEAEQGGATHVLDQSLKVNVLALGCFLEGMVQHHPEGRLFYASSSHIFEGSAAARLSETAPVRPASIYAISKVAGMQLCARYRAEFGLHASCGILFNHESPYRQPGFLSKKIARAAADISRAGSGVLEVGSLDAVVDWGAAADYVQAMHMIVRQPRPADYVVATGVAHSVRDFVEVAFRHVGLDYTAHVTEDPGIVTRESEPRIGDPARLKRETGWRPSASFEQMVAGLVDYELHAS